MSEDSDREGFRQSISRRKMLAVAGSSGIAALAGCAGGDGGSGETSSDSTDTANTATSGSGGQVYDATFKNAYDGNPVDLHFNSSASQNYSWPAGRAVFAPFLKYSFNKDEFLYGALDDLEITDEEVTLTFRDDLTWSDGDEWTTEDLDIQLQLAQKTGSSLFGYVDDFEMVDDKTAKLILEGPTNPRIIRFELTNFFVDTKAETHEEWVDKGEAEFLQWAWEDPVASGMFQFENKDRQAFEFSRNPEFYKSDNVNFETYLLENTGGGSAQHQALMAGTDVDAATSSFTPPEIAEQFPDHVVEVNIPAKWGYGIVFNHDDPDFGKRKVRQAIAHVINRQSIVDNAGPRTKFTAPIPCGIAPRDQEYWLGDWYDDFETYGVDTQNTEEATQLLEEAGYTKVDGTWQDSEGETLGGRYYSPAGWNDWTTMTQTVVSQLNEFGFDFTVTTKPTNDWFGQYSGGNFKMGSFYWLPGGSRSAFPYFPLYYQLWASDIGGGHAYRQFAQSEQTIPGPDGEDMTLDTPLSTVEEIAKQPDDEGARPFVQQAAWHSHIELPFLGLVSKYEQSWTTNDEWTEPAQDNTNRRVKWPQFWWVHEGDLQYDPN
ncbi:peptide/nickel transport system substrate-binding protein [Halogranum gelatinilyticum]|uniref:Peptide/nickel transport system substrate-binding protein n=2 Tax=Halogranum gelatinilyticum TaxID=660521 RepID=A0A1G9ZRF1_9EURY|nr:ABC transporter substrate-binding protein [Halogranum gelatinilyticum]SDN23687.1 peptide/nickel transport system substrate-binding protein [Halogranum gelatinilyticum]